MPRVKVFDFLKFDLDFLKGTQIYVITNSFRGRQAVYAAAMQILLRVRLSNAKNSSKRRVTRRPKLGRAHSRSLNETSCLQMWVLDNASTTLDPEHTETHMCSMF
jgi:hypothetical protein